MTTAIITGASAGLGRAIAIELAKSTDVAILIGRKKQGLLRTAEIVQQFACRACALQIDLFEEDAVRRIADYAETVGGVDILINNAAMQGPIGVAWKVDNEAFCNTMYLNFTVPVALCHAVIPQMIIRGGGHIVNISGGGGTKARPGFAAYAASKTALVRYSETLAHEVMVHGITVNCIAPGAFKSGMTDKIMAAGEGAAGEKEYLDAKSMLDDDTVKAKAAALAAYLTRGDGRVINGRLISAVWDDWVNLHSRLQSMSEDAMTLRRISN